MLGEGAEGIQWHGSTMIYNSQKPEKHEKEVWLLPTNAVGNSLKFSPSYLEGHEKHLGLHNDLP